MDAPKLFTIENQAIKVVISSKGSELQNIIQKQHNLEYLWQGDAAYWNRKAPILFPIVGKVNGDRLQVNDQKLPMNQHGFLRDEIFEVLEHTENSIEFSYSPTESAYDKFPFQYTVLSRYQLDDHTLTHQVILKNNGSEVLYTSLGFHPGFNVPLVEGLDYTDYYLAFNTAINNYRYKIEGGLIGQKEAFTLEDQTVLRLYEDLFKEDALVFKNPTINTITLKSDKNVHGLTMRFDGYSFLGIWAKYKAPFVCLEPWHGIADSLDFVDDIKNKEGILKIFPKDCFKTSYSIDFF